MEHSSHGRPEALQPAASAAFVPLKPRSSGQKPVPAAGAWAAGAGAGLLLPPQAGASVEQVTGTAARPCQWSCWLVVVRLSCSTHWPSSQMVQAGWTRLCLGTAQQGLAALWSAEAAWAGSLTPAAPEQVLHQRHSRSAAPSSRHCQWIRSCQRGPPLGHRVYAGGGHRTDGKAAGRRPAASEQLFSSCVPMASRIP